VTETEGPQACATIVRVPGPALSVKGSGGSCYAMEQMAALSRDAATDDASQARGFHLLMRLPSGLV
jgi:hypothetical protein